MVNFVMLVLYIVCMVLDLGSGDVFWIVLNIFVVFVNVGVYCGVDVDFVDIDFNIYCMLVVVLDEKFM